MMNYILFLSTFFLSLVLLLPRELFYRKKKVSTVFSSSNFDKKVVKSSLDKNKYALLIKGGHMISKLIPIKLPRFLISHYQLHIAYSNNHNKLSIDDYLKIKLSSAFLVGGMFFLIFMNDMDPFTISLSIVMTILGYFAPDNILRQKSAAFQQELMKQIPIVFSSLSIVIDAGLNLKQGLVEITRDQQGALIELIELFNKRISLGGSLEDEVNVFLDCTDSQEIFSFVSLLIQSDKKGGEGLAKGMKELSNQSWNQRKHHASVLAEKASMKLFLPMLFLVFPAILIVMVGPLVFSIMEMFS